MSKKKTEVELKTNFNIDEIKAILPHTYPFILIDRVVDMRLGEYVKAYKNVSASDWFFQGHFSTFPVMPGVLIIESLAQAGAFCILNDEQFKGKIPFLVGADRFKFKGVVRPGDRLDLEVEIKSQRQNFGIARAQAKVEDKLVCQGEIMFCITEPSLL